MAAVGIVQVQLSDHSHAAAIVVRLILQAENAHVPALAQQEAQFVLSLAQSIRAEGDHLEPRLVIGDAGQQVFLAQLFAVQIGFKKAQTGGVEPGANQTRPDREAAAQQRMAVLAFRRGDPVRRPGLIHFAGFKGALRLGTVPFVSLNGHVQAIDASWPERRVQLHAGGVELSSFPLGQGPPLLVQEPDLDVPGFFAFGVPDLERDFHERQSKAQRGGHAVDFQRFNFHS